MEMQIKEMDDSCLMGLLSTRLKARHDLEDELKKVVYERDLLKKTLSANANMLRLLRRSLFWQNNMELVQKIDAELNSIPLTLIDAEEVKSDGRVQG